MKNGLNILWLIIILSCNRTQPLAPYASEQPIREPTIFSGKTITTTNGISFSKDGYSLFTSKNVERKFDNGRSYASIFQSKFEEGKWTEPQKVNLSLEIDAYHPVLSSDNELLFFNSRSHLDSGNKSIKHNIWVTQKKGEIWSDARMLDVVNSSEYDSYPSIAKNKNLYFNSSREGGKGGMDIYVSRNIDGKYQKPENLAILNSSDEENDLVVDPLERFIIFNRYFHATQTLDLLISFKRENGWTIPRLLDNINSDAKWELTPTLSPDGKYFFYELDGGIMQMDLAYLIYPEELEGFGKRERLASE